MPKISFTLKDENMTVKFGENLAKILVPICKKLKKSILVNLEGDLGAGKTTMTRGFIKSLGYDDIVRSPTYTLVEPYEFDDFSIYHFDLYRLQDPEELEYMGIRDYFEKTAVCLIEWPDKAEGLLPPPDIIIHLTYTTNSREVVVESTLLDEKDLKVIASF